jgi:COP9 signalosome complex subunit 2
MTNLVTAYQQKDIPLFQKILQRDAKDILSDPFIRTYIDTILRSIRNQVIIQIIRPYKRIELSFLAGKVGVTTEEVEELLRLLILDHKLGRNGKVDRVGGLLVFDELYGEMEEIDRMDVLGTWEKSVDELWTKVVNSSALTDWAAN